MSRRRSRPTRGYRSTFEANAAARLKAAGFVYERVKLAYTLAKRYTPDWTKGSLVLEFKGVLTPADRTKMLAVKATHPHLDIRFVFQNAHNTLNKQSRTTYGAWATQHGFLWAHKSTPPAWLHRDLLS